MYGFILKLILGQYIFTIEACNVSYASKNKSYFF